jgi:hypothetical protein
MRSSTAGDPTIRSSSRAYSLAASFSARYFPAADSKSVVISAQQLQCSSVLGKRDRLLGLLHEPPDECFKTRFL